MKYLFFFVYLLHTKNGSGRAGVGVDTRGGGSSGRGGRGRDTTMLAIPRLLVALLRVCVVAVVVYVWLTSALVLPTHVARLSQR